MILRYCVECAVSLTRLTDSEYRCPNGHTYWNEPRTTVALVLLQGEKILVSKRGREPHKGKFDLPGGFMEYNEQPFEAAARELLEETGIRALPADMQLLTAYSGEYDTNESVCDLVIWVKSWQGEPVAADDVASLDWQSIDFLTTPDFVPPYDGLDSILKELVP